ncbi:MAG: DUF4824 family protein [Gammaproteobacteria bacterium]
MRKRYLFAALLLIIIVNAAVLAGVAWNRSGVPEASVVLSERECSLISQHYPRHKTREENNGIACRLQLDSSAYSPAWLDADKLRNLGFALKNKPGRRPLPRKAWVVLEFDGAAWQAALAEEADEIRKLRESLEINEATFQQIEYREESLQTMKTEGSRLVAIDAGTDPAVLRQRYPDTSRYLVLPARVRMFQRLADDEILEVFDELDSGKWTVSGSLSLLTDRIHVPLAFHAILADDVETIHYAVTLNVGKRYEGWIADFNSTLK